MGQPFKDPNNTHVVEIMNAADGLAYAQFFSRDAASGTYRPFMYGFHRKTRAEAARGVEALLRLLPRCPCIVRDASDYTFLLPEGAEAVCTVFLGQKKESEQEPEQEKELEPQEQQEPYYVFNICDQYGMPFYFSAMNYASASDAVDDFDVFQVAQAENSIGGVDDLKEIQ